MDKKKIVLGILVIILISATFVGTYAYFTATVSKVNEENKTTTITAKELANLYLVGDTTINNDNMIPGETSVKNIIITNPNEYDTCTALEIYNVTNTFVNQNDVTVTLYENTTKIGEVVFPNTGNTATIENLNIPGNTTKNYRLEITYKNTDANQNADMGKSLIGSLRAIVSDNCIVIRPTAYYEYGTPTTSSTTDYNTLGHNVFVRLLDGKKSICYLRNNEPICVDKDNFYSDKNTVMSDFGVDECNDYDYVFSCQDYRFSVYAENENDVSIGDYSASEKCEINDGNVISCGFFGS